MNAAQLKLWSQIEALTLDDPESPYRFTMRLAKENGWKPSFAARVVEEYRRFLFLAAAAGHPVSPPDTIDQAWHLHLLYTRSYWEDLCAGVLKRPLHHEPTRGGREESEKFGEWYAQTLASYRRLFGTEPPRDIWPSPAEMSEKESEFRRVNVSRYWLLPRIPSWFARRATPVAALALFGIPAILALETWNVLDWSGPDFLRLYVPLVIVAVLFSMIVRFIILGEGNATSATSQLTSDEAAYLAGGPQGAIGTAMGALVRTGQLEFQPDAKNPGVSLGQPTGEVLTPLQERVMNAVKSAGSATIEIVRLSVMPETDLIRSRLEQQGLLYSGGQNLTARLLAGVCMGLVFALGVVKLGVGLWRGKTILFLMLILVPVVMVLFFVLRKVFRTTSGDLALEKLRTQHAKLESAVADSATPHPAPDIGLALGLFGLGVLADGPGSGLSSYFHGPFRRPNGTWGDSSGGSFGCSSSSCSSSSCGGSSCGGGGCGGCGGGGD